MKRSWTNQVEASEAIARLAARYPTFGLDVRWTGVRTATSYEVERKVPNAYLVRLGYPDRFKILADGTPVR